MQKKRSKYFLIMSGLFLIVVLIGFARTLFLSSLFESPELPIHLVLHGIILTIWFSLAIAQPLLIATNNRRVHTKLGLSGYAVVVAVVAVSVLTLVIRDTPTIDEFPGRSGGNLFSLFAFSFCAILGLIFRDSPAKHKRLMLLASMPILAPAVDRMAQIPALNEFLDSILFWFPASSGIAIATLGFLGMIISVILHDIMTERRVHAGTLWGLGVIFIAAPAVTAVLTLTGVWAAFVKLVM